jgi:cytochrome P450
MAQRVDLTDQDFFRYPAARIAELRALGPVIRIKFPIIGKVWITTTYEMAGRVLKDSGMFTLRKEGGGVAGLRWWMPRTVRALANNMLTMDEPDHTRLRSIVDEAFRRRAVLEMEPRIFAMAEELAANLFADGSPADLVERYARRLPFAVISELLGLPQTDRARFMTWANAVGRLRGPLSLWRIVRVYGAMRPYFEVALKGRAPAGR